jgi:hypothetical protein
MVFFALRRLNLIIVISIYIGINIGVLSKFTLLFMIGLAIGSSRYAFDRI